MTSRYLIDANVLIEAANRYYKFERVAGFWDWLDEQREADIVRSVSLVEEEIDYPPELEEWVRDQSEAGLFLDASDPAIQAEYSQLGAWVIAQNFAPDQVAKFLDGADLWIVAAARVTGRTVVTQEVPAGPGSRKVKIPDVCAQFGVDCINTFEMCDQLSASF